MGNSFGVSGDVGVLGNEVVSFECPAQTLRFQCALRLFFIYQAWPRIVVPLCTASLGRVIFLVRKRSPLPLANDAQGPWMASRLFSYHAQAWLNTLL